MLEPTLASALQDMGALPGTQVVAVSAFYRSAPVDAQGPDFYNAVAELRTDLEPLSLLFALQGVEQAHGRQRPIRPRPVYADPDLLFYGQRVLRTPALTLPHPRLQDRAFVLAPLAELAPGLIHPVLGHLAPYRERLLGQALERLI